MTYPTPAWDPAARAWRVDLRGDRWGDFGRKVVPGGWREDQAIEAAQAALMLWLGLRGEAAARSKQLGLDLSGELRFADAADAYYAHRLKADKPSAYSIEHGAFEYIRKVLRWVKAELGHLHVSQLAPPEGNARLVDYRNDLSLKVGPKARSNRLTLVGQILRHCYEPMKVLHAVPVLPEPTVGEETLRKSKFFWQTEADFRALRAGLWQNVNRKTRAQLERLHPGAGGADAYIAQRRLYLSVGFYTGMHTRDLDELNDVSLRPTTGRFLRKNSKSSRFILPAVKAMPEPLWLDVQEEINRLGRFWHENEPIAGGAWSTVDRVLNEEAARLNLPRPVNPTVWRHSVAYHLALLGWSIEEAADYLGHSDTKMIREVYNQVVVEDRSRKRLDWTNENMAAIRGGITRRAVVFSFETARPGTTPAPARALQSVPMTPNDDGENPAERPLAPSRKRG